MGMDLVLSIVSLEELLMLLPTLLMRTAASRPVSGSLVFVVFGLESDICEW